MATKSTIFPSSQYVAGRLGISVEIYNDYIISGAPYSDDNVSDSGLVYIFKKDSGAETWTEIIKLTASDYAKDDYFGMSCSIYGNYAVASAPYGDEPASNDGVAYVFKKGTNDSWTEIAKLTAADTHASDRGDDVSIFQNYICIGDPSNSVDGNKSSGGAVYVYKINSSTDAIDEIIKITAKSPVANDNFGSSVSMYGNYIMTGAPYRKDSGNTQTGAAFIFKNNGDDNSPPSEEENTVSNLGYSESDVTTIKSRGDSMTQGSTVNLSDMSINSSTKRHSILKLLFSRNSSVTKFRLLVHH